MISGRLPTEQKGGSSKAPPRKALGSQGSWQRRMKLIEEWRRKKDAKSSEAVDLIIFQL